MPNRVSQPDQGAPVIATDDDPQPQRYLNSESVHFFSNDFRTQFVGGDDDAAGNSTQGSRHGNGWGIVLMIVTVGAPVLCYCVFAAM